jgi:F420-dependent oxidoreductase-like protein
MLAKTSKIRVGTGVMQVPARTPACAGTTAITLNELSGGRFILGVGPSGPGVVEGWHGQPYSKPLARTREYIAIVRALHARKAPLEFDGDLYQLPYRGDDATGLGLALKSTLKSEYPLDIYVAAFTPNGLRSAAEVAEGVFPIWMNPERYDLFSAPVEAGLANRETPLKQSFDIAPIVQVAMGDDLASCRERVKHWLALYIGGMGPREQNFYNIYAISMGYADDAANIQNLFLSGKQRDAVAAVPDALVDEVALVGPAARIKERLAAWQDAGRRGEVGTMMIAGATPDAMRLLANELL